MTDRLFSLDGCFNFRDLGGYPAANGSAVRWRRLFRADGPHALTAADAAALGELGIVTVLDLRTGGELERGRWTDHLGPVTEHHLPLTDVLPRDDELRDWSDGAYVARHYGHLLERGAPSIAKALEILAAAGAQPAMFHCSAGKDRTGVLSAVVLGLLGVADDDIVADYALSAHGMERFVAWLRERATDSGTLERHVPAVTSAEPETMRSLLAHVRAEYGSFEGYARAIGVHDAVPALRTALLTER
jgi:protein-tyrosine phosphatase